MDGNTVYFTVRICGDEYYGDMPADKWDEFEAMRMMVNRHIAGGVYDVQMVCAEWPDGTFIDYERDGE